MKIRPVGPSCSMRKDGQTDGQTDRQMNIQTDMAKLIFAVCSFAKGPKKKSMARCS